MYKVSVIGQFFLTLMIRYSSFNYVALLHSPLANVSAHWS